ncbi:LysR family transcriptional regulator [Paraburkholderia acidisoli]|uniref:LysR family transcriptional regulator n=1 Tax=Paraburkholderia acidisoli TaxID=2571748 RepID=A0A7Z2JGJ2_9BURK|nr:LysR family transcriptional regulator [Paraburkholderia acidisoli]QGZ64657.1 LysR family transcriptional regulator [Paraburkholderia acidisoli]
MKMDLQGLQMLVSAIESKSLSRAAEHENLATSGASKRIAELERRLGAVLLVRHARGVEPTPAGVALYHHAKSILRGVELAQKSVAEFGAGGMPKIRLAANRSSIIQYLPLAVSRYFATEPGAQIDLQERYSYDIPRLVTEGEADLGIYHARTAAPGVHSVPYRQDRVVLVVPLDHPLAHLEETPLEAAMDYPFVGYFPRHSYEAFSSLAEESLSRPLNVRIEVSNYEARCRLIREKVGIGVMPELIAASYLTLFGLKAVRLTDDWARRQFFICMSTSDHRILRPALVAFVDHLLAN